MPETTPITIQDLIVLLNKKANAGERTVYDELLRLVTAAQCIQAAFDKMPDGLAWLQSIVDANLNLDNIVEGVTTIFAEANKHVSEDTLPTAKEFTYNGKTYVVSGQQYSKDDVCKSCAFSKEDCGVLQVNHMIPPCMPSERPDGRRVYFEEKQS